MCIATMRTVTAAQRAVRVLSKEKIFAEIVGVDPSVTKNGCAFGVAFSCHEVSNVKTVLGKNNIQYGVIIGK